MSIFNSQIGSNTSDERKKQHQQYTDNIIRSKSNYKERYIPVDISKMKTAIVPLTTGGSIKIFPAQMAFMIKVMLDDMSHEKRYAFIMPYLKKPIIWTTEIETALTDGIRIYMSPAFAGALIFGDGTREADEFKKSLPSDQDWNDNKNRLKYRTIQTKYVRFVIIHEVYHIIYNHVRRSIIKYGANATKQEATLGNISMDLEINRDIESAFPDLVGSTETINGIWYKNEKYFKKKKKPFMKDVWEEIWDDFMDRNKKFNTSDPFSNEGANPVQKDNNQPGPYADGWRKAVASIKGKLIDPKTINMPGGSGTISQEQLADVLDQILKNAAQNED